LPPAVLLLVGGLTALPDTMARFREKAPGKEMKKKKEEKGKEICEGLENLKWNWWENKERNAPMVQGKIFTPDPRLKGDRHT